MNRTIQSSKALWVFDQIAHPIFVVEKPLSGRQHVTSHVSNEVEVEGPLFAKRAPKGVTQPPAQK